MVAVEEGGRELIDRIYEAATIPILWPQLLDSISSPIDSVGGAIFALRDQYVGGLSSPKLETVMADFFSEGWAARDPRLRGVSEKQHAGFLNDGDILTDEQIATDDVYVNFYRKRGCGYVACTLIPNPSGDTVGFAWQRHQDRGPVPRNVIHFLDGLRPHLARASMIAFRLGFERARAQADALQQLGLPAAVLRNGGRILAANALFEALIPSLFQDRSQRLVVTDPSADALWAEACAASTVTEARVIRSIPVAANKDRVPIVIHQVPVRRAAHDIFSSAASLLVLTPVDRASVPTAEVLQGLFDLTPAEARIARGIGQAQSVEVLARINGVDRETVRSQLRAVLSKTGLSRQQELVSLLAGTALRSN